MVKVFISHSSADRWVAQQIAKNIREHGGQTFLDCEDIESGDDFEEMILSEAESATELLVLFTPSANDRKYIWIEIGMFFSSKKRITGILYGITKEAISSDGKIPILLKKINSRDINEIDKYFREIKTRTTTGGENNV